MKKLILLSALILSACTGESISPSQNYQPIDSDHPLHITGDIAYKVDPILGMDMGKTLTVYIDSEKVISGQLSSDYSGELSGKYGASNIIAACHSQIKTQYWNNVNCDILIDNLKTVTLSF